MVTFISVSLKANALASILDDSFDVLDWMSDTSCDASSDQGETDSLQKVWLPISFMPCLCHIHYNKY